MDAANVRREEEALDALVASFLLPGEDDFPCDGDVEVLTPADREALEALGDDLVDRLLARDRHEGGEAC